MFVCLLVGIKLEKSYSASCDGEGSKHPGNGHTRAEAQTTCVPTTVGRLLSTNNVSQVFCWVNNPEVLGFSFFLSFLGFEDPT